MKIAIITGASSGMGREFALQMDCHFANIDEFWLVARREEELVTLAESLTHPCRIFAMDLTMKGQIQRIEEAARLEDAKICMLVQCAGFGLMGPLEVLPVKDTVSMIKLNCEALTELTGRMLPFMARNGRIIFLASSAAFLPQPEFSVYAASKSYVLSFARALVVELRSKEIYVTAVCPGPVDTPFFDIAEKTGSTLAFKKAFMACPEDVVAKALRDSFLRKPVSVYGCSMNAFQLMTKLLPHGAILSAMKWIKDAEKARSAESFLKEGEQGTEGRLQA